MTSRPGSRPCGRLILKTERRGTPSTTPERSAISLREFRTRRAELVSRVESLGDEQLAITALHPRLDQPMTVVDLAFFVAEHDDHHLAALTELLAR